MSKRANSEGSVYRRSRDGRWAATLVLPDGRRRAVYGRTQQEAIRKREQARDDRSAGLPPTSERITVGKLLERYLASVRPQVREKTFRGYAQQARLHLLPAFGRQKVVQLTSARVERFLHNQLAGGRSPRTVAYQHAIFRQALNWGMRQRPRLVKENILMFVRPPRSPHREVEPFTPEEARQFLAWSRGIGSLPTTS